MNDVDKTKNSLNNSNDDDVWVKKIISMFVNNVNTFFNISSFLIYCTF